MRCEKENKRGLDPRVKPEDDRKRKSIAIDKINGLDLM
jgi:hypothetical protein